MLSWPTARRQSATFVAAAVVLSALTALPANADGVPVMDAAPGEVAAPVAPVDVETTDVPPAEFGAELTRTQTSDFGMVGVTWSPDSTASGVTVAVRTRTGGQWSAWTNLEVDLSSDAGNPGTDPLWVGEADGVAARVNVEQGSVDDVQITTISTGDETLGTKATNAAYMTDEVEPGDEGPVEADPVAASGDGKPAYTSKPAIITRKSWGAAASGKCDTPLAGDRTRGVIVHHTAGSNSYSKSQSASIVRSTQAYHMKARAWCDLGYNFLVDKYGQIFEGRAGGVDKAVRAAHSGNGPVNTYTMGVSMMGNYEVAKLTEPLKDAMVKLIGWRLGTNYLPAKGSYTLGGRKLQMIDGHRNVVATSCPGKYGYAWLSAKGGLRDRVADYISKYNTPVKTLWKSLGESKVGPIYVGESKSTTGYRLRGNKLDLYAPIGGKAQSVQGAIRVEFNRMGGRTGDLGYPISARGTVTGGVRQRFEGGRIYQASGTSKAFALTGKINSLYVSLGESASALGMPTSSVTTKSGVSTAKFAKGSIEIKSGKVTAYNKSGSVLKATSAGAAKPARVQGHSAKVGAHSARIAWPKVSGATTYDVCLAATSTATTCLKQYNGLTTNSAHATKLESKGGADYFLKVRAVANTTAGDWSKNLPIELSTSGSVDLLSAPTSGDLALVGRGYGHGIGMSQYGAQGAARQGVKYDKILSTYYPGTTLSKRTGQIRVLLSAATSDSVQIEGSSGLKFRNMNNNKIVTLPTKIDGKKVKRWRIAPRSSNRKHSVLQYKTNGSYTGYKSMRWTGEAQFEGPAAIKLIMPTGKVLKYRGAVRSALPKVGATTRDTVNVLDLDLYLRGVVPSEMPSGWHAEALKAQSVAARTYAVRALNPGRYYDICDTTSCQVYGGHAKEVASVNSAISATAGKILTYKGAVALTQFSSSSGGFTAAGGHPYLPAKSDPYDGWSGNANHEWTVKVKAATIKKAYPSLGTLQRVAITRRTGHGTMGGRVESMDLIGSKKTVTIKGTDARWSFGLKSHWFGF